MTQETPQVAPANVSTLNTPVETSNFPTAPVKETANPVELAYDPKKYEAKTETPVETKTEVAPAKEEIDTHQLAKLAKTERKLAQKAKEAEELIKRADAIKGAFQEADIVQALQKVGVDPKEAFNKLMEYSLKETKTPKTPEEQAKDDNEARLKSYEDKLNQVTSQLEEERTTAAHNSAMANYVAPVISANPDKYETLISIYGSQENVIKEVYAKMYNAYIESNGKDKFTAEQAADAMEAHWSEQFKISLTAAQKLKKYKEYLRDPEEEKAKLAQKAIEEAINKQPLSKAERFENVLADYVKENPPVVKETKESPKTLTNNMNITPGSISAPTSTSSRREQIAKFMKDFKP